MARDEGIVESDDDAVEICIRVVERLGDWLNIWADLDTNKVREVLLLVSDFSVEFPLAPREVANMLSYEVNKSKIKEVTSAILEDRRELKARSKSADLIH
jgi:hypothetical protein